MPEKLRELADGAKATTEAALLNQFSAALDDDLNVSAAWARFLNGSAK